MKRSEETKAEWTRRVSLTGHTHKETAEKDVENELSDGRHLKKKNTNKRFQ